MMLLAFIAQSVQLTSQY